MAHLRLRHWIVGAGVLIFLFAPNNVLGTGNEEVVYEFSPQFKGWALIQWEDPGCTAYHLEREVFMYLSQNPAVPVRAMLFPVGFVRDDLSVFIRTAQEKLYRLQFRMTALRSGVGAQGWGVRRHSFDRLFLWVTSRSSRANSNSILSALRFPSRRFVRN